MTTTITTEGASENTDASATPGTAEAPKTGGCRAGIAGAVKDLFRDAAKVLLRRADAPPPQERRRSGETEGDFKKLARKLLPAVFKDGGAAARGRYAALQDAKPMQIIIPEEFLYADTDDWNVFDVTHPLYDHGDSFDEGDDFGSDFDTGYPADFPAPHL